MIIGKKVGLRPLQSEDAWLLYKWHNDRRVTEDLGIQDALFCVSMDEERGRVERMITSGSDRHLIIRLLGDGRDIGLISLHRLDPRNSSAELRIIIGEPSEWDKGYGGDAVKLLVDYAFNVLNLHRIYLRVTEYNKRAIACFRTSGFEREGVLRDDHFHLGAYMSSHLMSILRDEGSARSR